MIADAAEPRPRRASESVFTGRVWSVRTDVVDFDGEPVVRDVIEHPGAVGVLVLDDRDRVLVIRQYRHAVGRMLWEAPAGLLDVPGETALDCARRELVEEAGLEADRWHVLVDFWNSPGGSTEAFRCFLARDVTPVDGGRPPGTAEERELPAEWVDLDDVVSGVLSGRLGNPTLVMGSLAAAAARSMGWATLREPDSEWAARPGR